jgi:hypothetical protein
VEVAGDFVAAAALKEVEVCSFVGLHYVLDVEGLIAAGHCLFRSDPGGAALLEFGIGDFEGEGARFDVEGDPVAFLNKGQRAA